MDGVSETGLMPESHVSHNVPMVKPGQVIVYQCYVACGNFMVWPV